MIRRYAKNVLPAMLAFAFSGIYAIVDGLFIGRNIGDVGVAAINVAWPLVVVVQALGTGIGMSGAVNVSVSKAGGDTQEERRYLGNTMVLLLLAGFFATVILSFTYPYIVHLFGGRGDIETHANEYIKYLMWFAAVQIISTGLVPIVRNYRGAYVAMGAMIAGFVTNVVLDWLMVQVLQMGMKGGAIATVIGQVVTIIPCVIFLWYKGLLVKFAEYKPRLKEMLTLLRVGVSPFGLTLVPTLVVIIFNLGALKYGGNEAVACYAVVNYIVCVVQLLMQGVGDGSQPLISTCYGSAEYKNMRKVTAMAYITAMITAVLCIPFVYCLRYSIPEWFGSSPDVREAAAEVLKIFVYGFPCIAIMRVTTAYFYATKRNIFAYILIYCEPIVLALFALTGLPETMGLKGLWLSMPLSQVVLAVMAVILMIISLYADRRARKRETASQS